ncbi:hypothetical protein T01_15229 [Trichinella spiralis]|uniref:Uncharacterized protein n=1 Tax=Trichinella spiralis TaxID=6334 RepID=A0A0V1B8C7_TRISP|nr:hypothetical protein T01_15229 [Trichinella spiralis]
MNESIVDNHKVDHFVWCKEPQCIGHVLPNKGALGTRIEKAVDNHTLAILPESACAHALQADLMSASTRGQHAALRLQWLRRFVLKRRLRRVQKPMMMTLTSRHRTFPSRPASSRLVAILQTP